MRTSNKRIATIGSAYVALCLTAAMMQTPSALGQQPGGKGKAGVATITPDPRVQQKTYHFDSGNPATSKDLSYVLFVSSKVKKNEKAPLIVALHGLGGDGNFLVREKMIDLAEEQGYIVVGPLGYTVGGWYGSLVATAARPTEPPDLYKLSEMDVMKVFGLIKNEYTIDPKRTYLMGHSMGGAGTLFMGQKYVSNWAALAAIAPAAFAMQPNRETILKPIADAKLPVIVVQGDMDTAVPVANTRQWIETMKAMNMDYQYREIAGGDHGTVKNEGMADIFAFFQAHAKE